MDLFVDFFIVENIDEVMCNMWIKGVFKFIVLYICMWLSWIVKQLQIGEEEVQDIVSYFIVDGRVQGWIDEYVGMFEIEFKGDVDCIQVIEILVSVVGDLYMFVFKDLEGFKIMQLYDNIMMDMYFGDDWMMRLLVLGYRRDGRSRGGVMIYQFFFGEGDMVIDL